MTGEERMGAGMARKAQRARASASHATIRRWGACDTAALGCDTAGGLGHDTARPAHDTARRARSWARQCAPRNACWASWVLVHPTWFFELVFDSVIFLSLRLDLVHEHCSSQNFLNFFKKN